MTEDDLPPMEDVGPVDAPAIDDAPPEATEAPPPPSVEDIAANMGWSPKENWRGDPDKWKPAHEFVAATADINAKLVAKLNAVDQRTEVLARTYQAATEKALAEQRQQLLAERREAIEFGDVAKVEALDEEIQALPSTTQPQPAQLPEVQTFVEKHAAWFGKDQEATNWARNRAGELAAQGIGPARQLATVERELGTLFPEYAEKPKPKPVALSQPGNRGATKRALTLADLPKEAQQAAAYFKTKGVSTEEYLASYAQSQEA